MNDNTPTARAGLPQSILTFLEMIKFSHSVFALPFALSAAVLAAGGLPDLRLVFKIVLACFLARTAAMSFNRWADRQIDARNPRTASRAIPAGRLSAWVVLLAAILSSLLFVLTAALINSLALALSPLALAVLFGYSYTKRFTQASHLILGLALGLSPVGAWIAVTGTITLRAVFLGFAVLLWTAGFDVIYACQDVDFDRRNRLFSTPSRLGIRRALWISRALHATAVVLLVATGLGIGGEPLGVLYYVGVTLVAALLVHEQSLVRADDLSRVNVAFFTLNGCVSLAFMATTMADVFLGA